MGAIEDVYEDLDTDVPFEEFESAVEDKVEQMGGLADEETAAMLIAHELRDEEVEGIADVRPGMDDVKFLGKVVSVGEKRTFERDDEEAAEGRVVNVEVADETGRIRVAMWDEMADAAVDELAPGDVLRVAGRPKEGYNGVEVSADKAEPDPDAEVDVQVKDAYDAADLSLGLSDVDLVGTVLATESVRTFDRDDGTEGRVANLTLGDETGRVRVTLWDEIADRVEELDPGETVEVVDGYVRERDGDLELHVGDRGAVETVDEDVEYVPETTDVADVEIGQTVDLAGGVVETSEKRTFDRDDGSEGQVRNVRLKDETGDIRVALWGEKADMDVELADRIVCTDVEIQDGWQDELEASAGWRSTVTVLDDEAGESERADRQAAATTGGADRAGGGGASDADQGGLGAFADADAGDAGGTEAATATTDDDPAAGETVEFTGTVVQAGDPVVLDDGSQTYSVDTAEDLRLGEEVTVRGEASEGTIDADDVF